MTWVTVLAMRFVVLILFVVGCSSTDTAPDALSKSCMEADMHSDLTWIQEKIFTPSCASFRACHKDAATSAGGLNLEAGMAMDELVDRKSIAFDEWVLVKPGDPQNSYLMVMLGEVNGPVDPMTGFMPYGNPKLCQPKIDAVSRWITSLPK